MNIPTPLSLLNLDPETNARVHSILASGTAPNTRRAYASDLRYFWAWARLALGLPEAYPAPLAAVIRFVTDHLEGLPETVNASLMAEGAKSRPGVHSIATVARRLAALSVAHKSHGQENPVQTTTIRALMAAARRGRARLGLAPQKKRAATLDVLEAMLATCEDDLHGLRDRALLLFAFASGGRRRSEVASALVENLPATTSRQPALALFSLVTKGAPRADFLGKCPGLGIIPHETPADRPVVSAHLPIYPPRSRA